MSKKVLILGYGDIANRLSKLLSKKDFDLYAVSKSIKKIENFYMYDWLSDNQFELDQKDFDSVIFFPKPFDMSEAGYKKGFIDGSRSILNILEKINFRKLILISSTRVYGREQIGLLDESTKPQPSDYRGKLVYDYENLFIKKYNKEAFVLRFAGLYTNKSEVTFLNNLHRDSAAEIIYFILSNQNFETKSYIINCVNSVNAVPGERLISNKKLIDLGFKFRDI
jgi:nucleoside-diphosphate-sugar epimerase